MWLDTHHHLDFLPPKARQKFLARLFAAGVQSIPQTLTPSGFLELTGDPESWPEFQNYDARISVGFHPWFIGDDVHIEHELEIFKILVRKTRFFGEAGLDFSPKRLEKVPESRQVGVFRRLLQLVAERAAGMPEPFVISIHAVRSATKVLDLLEETAAIARNVVPVFHWFTGTSDELNRLTRLGGYISVNPKMFDSKRGLAYLKQVPIDRILLETDLPSQPIRTVTDISELVEEQADEVVGTLGHMITMLDMLRIGEDIERNILQTQHRLYGDGAVA